MSDGDVRGFLHVCCIGGYREVTWEIVHSLLESRLYDRSATIDVAVLGSDTDQRFVEDLLAPFSRFRIAYRSTDLTEYEFPALALVQDACQSWDGPVYYLHTKGVSYSPHNQYAHYWRRLMLDVVVSNHQRCLAALKSCDTAGANWSDAGLFSGNFWWARSSHIRRLPDIRELKLTPRNVTAGARLDGDLTLRRGMGPVWNQRLQCEYWLQMVPARSARLGPSRANLYRELCWTTSVGEIVDELLAVAPGRRYAELRVGGPSRHFSSVDADRRVFVPLGSPGDDPHADLDADFFDPALSEGRHDVILLEIRHDPAHLADLLDRCLPMLSRDGAVVVRYSNPPTAWHQREADLQGSEWTGQVWRAVVDFRIRHPDCEVFTVDTDWGCTVIRPGRRSHRNPEVDSVNPLEWKDLVLRRRQLLNVVDVEWFRRNLYATRYLAGSAQPVTGVELANVIVSAAGADSFLQIGCDTEAFAEIIAPIRHRITTGEEPALSHYDVVLVGADSEVERALGRVSEGGWIISRETLLVRGRTGEPATTRELLSSFCNKAIPRASDGPGTTLITQPYEGNLAVLHSAVELDPEDIRSAVFLGDAYFRDGHSEAARTWYTRAADMRDWWWKGFDKALYVGLLRVARLMEGAGESAQSVRDTFLRAWEICPDRPTPLYAIAVRYRREQRYQLGYLYAKPVADLPCPDPDTLRLPGEVASWRARDELAHCAFMIGKRDEAFALWRQILRRDDVPDEDRRRIADSRDNCVPAMLEAASSYPEEVVRAMIAAPGDPRVVVTMVAGPALVTAERTLNSLLNCCRDVSRVGRFLVVDAGLAQEDRASLQDRYGFLEFVEFGPTDFSSLPGEFDARLWLHLDRDWRFFAQDNFITRSEAVFATQPHVVRVSLNADADGPMMYDTARLDRATPSGLHTATLDDAVCLGPTRITVIGRGNSGTRAVSRTLMRSGVFMGEPIKPDSADLVPAEDMYEACRIIARYIPWLGGLNWDFGPVQTMPIPAEFTRLVQRYLSSVLSSPALRTGWKLPETTLCYPWITRLFPDIRYIFWVRNPRDCITNHHFTDDLADFGIDYPRTDDVYLRRAISWKYQDDLVAATPRPRHWISVRLEDFITQQEHEVARLEKFLGFPLARIPVRTDPIDRHKREPEAPFPGFLVPAMRNYRYTVPGDEASH